MVKDDLMIRSSVFPDAPMISVRQVSAAD